MYIGEIHRTENWFTQLLYYYIFNGCHTYLRTWNA